MTKLGCCSALTKKKKKCKGVGESPSELGQKTLNNLSVEHHVKSLETDQGQNKGLNTLPPEIKHPTNSFTSDELKSSYLSSQAPFGEHKYSVCNVKAIGNDKSLAEGEPVKFAYEAEDEHEDDSSMKRDFSDFDLQFHHVNSIGVDRQFEDRKMSFPDASDTESEYHKDGKMTVDMESSGHASDPGIGKAKVSPLHKRSCSNIESTEVYRKLIGHSPLPKSRSCEQLQELAVTVKNDDPRSPVSVMSHRSADRVILKKHSSSQVLPSRNRRLWWKLFLWSHRNSHIQWIAKPHPQPFIKVAFNLQGGYSSDTLEPTRHFELDKANSPTSFSWEPMKKAVDANESDDQSWDGVRPQNQWVAFSVESSSYARVDDWVKDLDSQQSLQSNNGDDDDGAIEEGIIFPPSPENDRSPARSTSQWTRRPDINVSEEVLHANNLIRSLNSSSTVAHISGIGLKVIPSISCFSSLRSVNLSNNLIAHIPPGSLPKRLHSLNLSRNKIQTIEGLRELHRLRVLDLSYNRISRIGHGLSNCTLIKELYLAGNKISDVEGLHRLLKLKVLDLSFNKITTTKSLGQLVANYNSMLALNLLGNPIQNNVGDDQMRKAVCGLLPNLVYLNRQPIKPQRAREVVKDSVAKAALGMSMSPHRKTTKRVSRDVLLAISPGRHSNSSNASVVRKSRSRSKTGAHHLKTAWSTLPSPTPSHY